MEKEACAARRAEGTRTPNWRIGSRRMGDGLAAGFERDAEGAEADAGAVVEFEIRVEGSGAKAKVVAGGEESLFALKAESWWLERGGEGDVGAGSGSGVASGVGS